MSDLENLIQKLCPNGVEYKELGEVSSYEQPSKYIVSSTDYKDEYTMPVLTAGQTFILGYTNEQGGVYKASKENPVIIFDDFTTSFHWVEFDFKVKSSAMKMLRPKNESCIFKYVYYAMQTIKYTPADHTRQWIEKYSKFTIPVPPIEVQREIVRILDNFTELTARKKQYEYYRDKLLSFDKPMSNGGGYTLEEVKYIKLGEVADIGTGNKPSVVFDKESKYEYINAGTTNSGYTDTYNCEGDIVVTPSRGQGGIGYVGYQKTNFWLGPLCYGIKAHTKVCCGKFIYYALSSKKESILQMKKEGSVPALNLSDLCEIEIPVPPLEVQTRIVSILDKFEMLLNSLASGLPTEIEARKKQYEYYRDRLLTFKPIAVSNA